MKANDKVGTMALRMVRTEITKRRTAKAGVEVTDELVVDTIRAYVKQLLANIGEFAGHGLDASNDSNVAQMAAEAAFLDRYLPKLLSEDETAAIIDAVIAAQGTVDAKQAGKITGLVMKDHKGKVDAGVVARLVKQKLGG
jgi:uncharacterized protein YqeY